MSQCLATTGKGSQCKNRAQDDSDFCHVHGKDDYVLKDNDEYDSEDNESDGDTEEVSWDTIEGSRNNHEGTLLHIDEQFRNRYPTLEERLQHASELLDVDTYAYGLTAPYTQVNEIVYHGGKPLSDATNVVFFVSKNKADAEKYGPVTSYRITQKIPVHNILWDQLAANYGFDVNFSKYKNWEDFDEDFDSGTFDKAQKKAEINAHKLLTKAYANEPLVIGSNQDEEYGFFPSAHTALIRI